MSMKVGDLFGELDLKTDKFDKGIASQKGAMGTLTGVAKKVALGVGAAMAGAAIAGSIAFVGFQGQMNEVFTLLPDMTGKQMDKMTGQVKDFAVEFGVLPDKVVPALYQAISAGVPKENVFEFLETAQKAAVGGVTELETAVDGISSVVNAYGSDVVSAAEASDLMFTAVKGGKTDFEQLSASLFNVIPTASALGVEFGDVTAAIATMTAMGTPTSVATTQMRQMLVELSKAGSAAAKTFEDMAGKSFKDFIAGGGNVQEALQIMEKGAAKSGKGINDLFGSVEAGSAALSLTGKGTEKFAAELEAAGASAGATEKAYSTMEKGLGRAFDKIKAAVMVLLINFGEQLAPALEAFANWINSNMPAIQATMSGAFKAIGNAVQGLVALIGPVIAWLQQTWAKLFGAGGSMQGDTAGLLATVQRVWGQIQTTIAAAVEMVRAVVETAVKIVTAIWEQFGEHIVAHLETHLNALIQIISGAWDVIKGIFEVITGILTGDWTKFWGGIQAIVSGVWNVIQGLVKAALNIVSTLIGAAMAAIAAVWRTSWNAIRTFISAVWDGIKNVVKVGIRVAAAFLTGGLSELIPAVIRHWDDIKGVFSRAWERIKDAVSTAVGKVVGFIKDMGGDIIDFIKELPGKLFNLGKEMIKALIDGLTSGLQKLWDIFNSIMDRFNDLLSFGGNAAEDLKNQLSSAQSGLVVDVRGQQTALGAAAARGGDTIVQASVTLDAKNVKDFNDVVKVFEGIGQAARQGVAG